MKPFVSVEDAKKQVNKIVDNAYLNFIKYIKNDPLFRLTCVNSTASLKKPKFYWRKFGFNVAGCTYCQSNFIEMNINFLYSKDYNKFIQSTSLHELAHSIAYQLFNDNSHGKNWKFIDEILGDTPSRCHDYAKPENAPKKLKYIMECSCGAQFKLNEKTYNAALLGQYCCIHCKSNLINAKFIEKKFI